MRTAAVVLFAIGVVLAPGCKKNHAPDAPAVPTGPTPCAVGVSYSFSSSAADPDGDSVAIRFDWGDGDTSDWSTLVASGETVTTSHSWLAPGTFDIRAQARDGKGSTSAWTSQLTAYVIAWWGWILGGADDDEGFSAQQTQDGGYIVTGYTHSFGARDSEVWLVKTDANGNRLWDRTLKGRWGSSVKQLPDGGYVIVGMAMPSGLEDVCLIRTDEAGNEVWWKSFGGLYGDQGYSAELTQDGGFIISGSTWSYGAGSYDVWLLKVDSVGNKVWDKTFGGSSGDWGYSVLQTSDGGYVVVSTTESYGAGSSDAWLVKTDSLGNKVWDEAYGGSGEDNAYSVLQTSDGGYVIVGSTRSTGAGGSDVWLTKTDSTGTKVWDRTFGGQLDDRAYSVQQTADGGYAIAGETQLYGGGQDDVWLIRTDEAGNRLWDMAFGGSAVDYSSCVSQTAGGASVVAGTTNSLGAGGADAWLIKVDAGGE